MTVRPGMRNGIWAVLVAGAALAALPSAATAQGTGLFGEYWDNTSSNDLFMNGVDVSRVEGPISFVFSTGGSNGFTGLANKDWTAVRWQGILQAPATPASGDYIIMPNVRALATPLPTHDDGVRIWIDGVLVYDRWKTGASTDTIVPADPITLAANERKSIRIDYFQGTSDASMNLYWQLPAGTIEVIPLIQLYPDVATPKISPQGGAYTNGQLVDLTCDHVGATIHYTTDGSVPTTASTAYTGPFTVSSTTRVRAIAAMTGMTTSAELDATLTITDATAPTISQVHTPQNNVRVFVTFSEPVQSASATTLGNYVLSGGLTVSAAALEPDQRTVILTTSAMADATTYTVAVSGVQDLAGNAIAAGTVATFRFADLSANLAYYWRFDEGTGNSVADDVVPLAGSVVGDAPVWIRGKRGRALDFNGVNQYLQLTAANIGPNVDNDVTVSGWILTMADSQGETNGADGCPTILGANHSTDNNRLFLAYLDDDRNFEIQTRNLADDNQSTESSAPLPLLPVTWVHFTTVREVATGTLRVYINGVESTPPAIATGSQTADLLAAYTLSRLMVLSDSSGNPTGDSHWLGGIDELRIYTAALSAQRIYDLYNEPPVVDAGPNASVAFGGSHPLTATVTDTTIPTGGAITYAWTQVSGPGVANFSSTTVEDPTVTFTQGGVYVLRLTASDGTYSASDDVTIDVSRITISPLTLTTSETGTTANFTITLTTAPGADVTIDLVNGDATEGSLSLAQVVLNDANMSQQVTVTGVDDAIADGNIVYTITTNASSSTNSEFDAINLPDVQVTNNDDDIPGITVAPTSLSVTEGGASAQFTVVLQSQPSGNVVITVAPNNAEATVSTGTLTFTTADWDTPQPVDVTAFDDVNIDFTQSSTILLNVDTAATADAAYDALNPADVGVTVFDNEVIPEPEEAWGNCGGRTAGAGAAGWTALLALAGVLALLRRS